MRYPAIFSYCRTWFSLLFLLLCLACVAPLFAADSSIALVNGWVRETPPNAQNAAAFLTVRNNSSAAKNIVAVQCNDVAARCELHEHLHSNGVMRMQKVTAPLAIPANGTLAFMPGGYHIMMFGLRAPLRKGTQINLTLVFDDHSTWVVQLPVKSVKEE
jgi:copper(I)-binding protein